MFTRPTAFLLASFFTNACANISSTESPQGSASSANGAQGTVPVPDVTYEGGETIALSEFGVSFTIPAGWLGQLDHDIFTLWQDDAEGFMFLVAATTTLAQAQEMLAQPIDLGSGITAVPVGAPVSDEDMVSIDYDIRGGTADTWAGIGITVVGDHGVGASILSVFPEADFGPFERATIGMALGVTFNEPTSATMDGELWGEELTGVKLTDYYIVTDYFEREIIYLCSDGQAHRSFESTASFLNESLDGTWTASGPELRGQLDLRLLSGDQMTFQLTRDADGALYLNGQHYFQEDIDC